MYKGSICTAITAMSKRRYSTVSLATFRSDYEYGIEYAYDFRISNQLLSQNCHSSMLLKSREEDSSNKISVTNYYLKHASKI